MPEERTIRFSDLIRCASLFGEIFLDPRRSLAAPPENGWSWEPSRYCEIKCGGKLIEATSFDLDESRADDFDERAPHGWEMLLCERVFAPDVPGMARNLLAEGETLGGCRKSALIFWAGLASHALANVGEISERLRERLLPVDKLDWREDWLRMARAYAGLLDGVESGTGMDALLETYGEHDFLHGFRIRQWSPSGEIRFEHASFFDDMKRIGEDGWKPFLQVSEFTGCGLRNLFRKDCEAPVQDAPQKFRQSM